jgi:hypothetical protein
VSNAPDPGPLENRIAEADNCAHKVSEQLAPPLRIAVGFETFDPSARSAGGRDDARGRAAGPVACDGHRSVGPCQKVPSSAASYSSRRTQTPVMLPELSRISSCQQVGPEHDPRVATPIGPTTLPVAQDP